MRFVRTLGAVCLAAGVLFPAGGAGAQSLLERPPNLSGGWVGAEGQMHFNFMHRFAATRAPERKVVNYPTFTIAAGLPYRLLAGASYTTNSNLTPRYPNEWELFVRHAALSEDYGAALDLSGQLGYNLSAEGLDAEVTAAKRVGAARLIGVVRNLTDPLESGRRWAIAGGGTFRVSQFVALAGDVGTLTSREDGEKVAWSAGVHVAIPGSPHTLSLHYGNSNNTTLQGASRGDDQERFGFEFTVPLTLARYFGGGGDVPTPPPPPPAAPAAAPAAGAVAPTGEVVRVGMRNMAYTPARLEIAAGTTVEWVNNDPLVHTVTAPDKSFDSGNIPAGGTFRHTFTTPGTYTILCTPHPFMRGLVVVR